MTDFTNSNIIHSCLGDYWYSIYLNNEQVGNYISSICFNREQWDYQFRDTKDCLSRKKVPIYESIKVKPIYVLKSDFLKDCEIYAQHDGTYMYNGTIYFDIPVLSKYRFKLPDNIANIQYISAKLLDDTKYKVEVVNNYVSISFDLFNGSFKIDPVYNSEGIVVDYTATVWLFDISIDKEDMFYQYGYIFNIKMPSSVWYTNLINVLYDSLINGPSENSFRLYLSAVTGIPVSLHDSETIKEIECTAIITDKDYYTISDKDKSIVKVGDIVNIGDPLTEGITFYKPKEIDDSVKAISLGRNYISTCAKEIVFENKDIPVSVYTDNNYSRLDFPVKGTKDDVKAFNDAVFINGINNNIPVSDDINKSVLDSFK